MKRFLPLLLSLSIYAGADVASAHAQFVHLKFETRSSLFEARGSQAGRPWDTGGMLSGIPMTFDIYYDASTAETSPDSSTFAFTDSSKNFFHVGANLAPFAPGLPALNITRPIDSIHVLDTGINLTFFHDKPYETLDAFISFATPLSSTHFLPVPELPPLLYDENGNAQSGFSLNGGQDMFRLPHPGFGFATGALELVSASVNPEFPPVPEPSTYGLGGLAVMSAAIAWRHRRQQKTVMPQGI